MAAGDLSEIDKVIFAALNNDTTLRALVPEGVFWDVAPGATEFVLLSRSEGDVANALANEVGWLTVLYLAKAVIASASVVAANDAAFRIHEILDRGLQDVVAGNYLIMQIERTIPIRYTEVDPQNTAVRWQHNGGQYSVMMCPTN